MEIPPEISFRDVEPSDRIRARLEEEIAKLERYCDAIIRCRVVVEVPHKRHESGNLYHVRIDVTVPGQELVVSRDPPKKQKREELETAVVDAFGAMRRQVEEYSRKRRREVKHHESQPRAKVAKLFPTLDYGFLETRDGTEVYFHRNSLLDADFDELEIGDTVRFAEEEGVEGPQASTVHVG
jgi:ribosomal subunit interface protein